jgi:hypothetical protein
MGIALLTMRRRSVARTLPIYFSYTWRRVRIHQLRTRTGTHCHYAPRKCAEMRENPVKFGVFRTKSVVKFYLNGAFPNPVIRLFARLSVHGAPRSTHYPILNEASRGVSKHNELILLSPPHRMLGFYTPARLDGKPANFRLFFRRRRGSGKVWKGDGQGETLPPPVRGIMAPTAL